MIVIELEICCTEYPYSVAGATEMGNDGVLGELSPLLDVAPSPSGTG